MPVIQESCLWTSCKKHKIAAGSAGKSYFKDKSSDVRKDSHGNQLQQTDSRHLRINLICLKTRCSSISEQPMWVCFRTSCSASCSMHQDFTDGLATQRARQQKGRYELNGDGFFPQIFLQINPEKRKSKCDSQRYRTERKTLEQLFLELKCWSSGMVCWDDLKQSTNIKWSKKPTEQRQSQLCSCYCFLFPLLQKVIRNMHADAKINKVWSFITWFSSWCKMKYLLVAPVAIALCVATLAHLARFHPEHFCKWKTFCVVY